MSHVVAQHEPPATVAENLELAMSVVGWLDDLLDAARDRSDLPLARLIAGVMDDLGAAAAKG